MAGLLAGIPADAGAASATWNASPTDANWVTTTQNNWSTGAGTFPGAISGLTNTDTATFTGASSQLNITINSASLNIGSITFSGTSEPAYTIGSTAGNSLFLTSGGQIGISSNVTGGSITNAVNAPLVLEPGSGTTAGTYAFQSSSGTTSHILVIGTGVSGGTTTQGITLTLTGANTGANAINGNITDGGAALGVAVSKTSAGTWVLAGVNTFSGGLSVTGGEVDAAADSNLGAVPTSTTSDITINGGRVAITASTTLNAFRTILLGANPTGGNTTGSFSTSGSTTTVIYNGVFQDLNASTTGDLVKQGGGILQLGGASTYSGNTFLNNGTTQLTAANNRLPTGTTVALGQAASKNTGTLDLNGFNQQVAGLNSTNSTTSTPTTKNTVTTSTTASTLTLGGSGTYAYGDGTALNSGLITGALSINKTGAGTQTFGDNNTYTGSTTVSGGTLVVGTATTPTAKALGGTSGVFVNNTGTLQMGAANQLNATTPAPLTLSGTTGTSNAATFSINGNSQGSATANGVGALTLTVGSANNVIDFNGKTGTVTFTGLTTNGTALTVNNYLYNNGMSGQSDRLIFNQDQGPSGTNSLGNIVFTGYGATMETALGSGFYEVFPAVPEPATIFSGLLLVGALGWSQRRRMRLAA